MRYVLRPYSRFLFLSLALSCSAATSLFAQKCRLSTTDVPEQLAAAATACDSRRLSEVAADVDKAPISEFRRLSNKGSSYCLQVQRSVRTILAKFGDKDALDTLEQELNKDILNNVAVIEDLGVVGDDNAIAILMRFVRRLQDMPPENRTYLSGGDTLIDPLRQVSEVMRKISMRRALKDVPGTGLYIGSADARVWLEWWNARGNGTVSSAIFEDVSDVHLRCLARKVEWGFSNAILEMGATDSPVALSILRRFPRDPDRGPAATIEHNLEAALARLGDQGEFNKIAQETKPDSPTDPSSTHSIYELRYIGGRSAVEALINALRIQLQSVGAIAPESSTQKTKRKKPHQSINDRILTERNESFQKSILAALASMVKNPPLSSTASPSTENIQEWLDWWAKNRDTAQFVKPPVSTYE